MSVMTRRMKKEVEKAAILESTPSPKTITDVPPEVLEMILKKLDTGKNPLLPYRLVHPGWIKIIDDLLEKRALKGGPVAISTAFIVNGGDWFDIPDQTIRVPLKILQHPGNPFPGRSFLVTQSTADRRIYGKSSIIPFNTFITKFGSHLNTFALNMVHLRFPALIQILQSLFNLKTLKLSNIFVDFNSENETFPTLPQLKTLELQFMYFSTEQTDVNCAQEFFRKLFDAYVEQLISLKLPESCNHLPRQQRHLPVENCPFQKLEQLSIHNPSKNFLRLSCIPPAVKHLSIVGAFMSMGVNVSIDNLMRFVDKFSDTLESLVLDCPWSEILTDSCMVNAFQTGGVLQTAGVALPKLTKLTVSYPTNKMERAVIKKTFQPKFPALRELHLFHFNLAHDVDKDDYENPTYTNIIKGFLHRERYSSESPTLSSVSVWLTGEKTDMRSMNPDNNLVYFMNILLGTELLH